MKKKQLVAQETVHSIHPMRLTMPLCMWCVLYTVIIKYRFSILFSLHQFHFVRISHRLMRDMWRCFENASPIDSVRKLLIMRNCALTASRIAHEIELEKGVHIWLRLFGHRPIGKPCMLILGMCLIFAPFSYFLAPILKFSQ